MGQTPTGLSVPYSWVCLGPEGPLLKSGMCWAEGGLGGQIHDNKSFPWRAHLGRGSLITQAAFFREAYPMSDTPLNLVTTS